MRKYFIPSLILLLFFIFVLSLSFGTVKYEFKEIIFSILHPSNGEEIILKVRLPRVISAFFVGASLSLAGLLSQTLFLNPLADPYLFGISSGANFFVTLSLFLGLEGLFPHSLSLFSFLGALFSTFLVFMISKIKGRISPLTLLLSGIALNYLFSSLSTLFTVWGRDVLNKSVFWSMTGLSNATWLSVKVIIPFFLVSLIISIFMYLPLNVYILGEHEATSLGVNVVFTRTILLILIALLTGSSVYVSGIIGFIGLMVPNILRGIFGTDHLKLIPLSVVSGGALLMLSDLISRTAFSPTEIPVSIITSLLGVPFFFYILWRERPW